MKLRTGLSNRMMETHDEDGDDEENLTLEDFDFGSNIQNGSEIKSENSAAGDLSLFSDNHFVVLDSANNNQEHEERNRESPTITESSSNSSPESGKSRRRKKAGSISDEERKRRNTEASARFRIKRRLKEQEVANKVTKMRTHISGLKIKVKTLEMENNCLKRMLLGASPDSTPNYKSESVPKVDDDKTSLGSLTNYELLKLIRQKSNEGFKITSF